MVELGTVENDAVYLTSGWQALHGRKLNESIQLRSGRFFWPLQPRADELDFDSMVHAICNEGRFANHTPVPYNVGNHCVQLVKCLLAQGYTKDDMIVKWALFHDASEAIINDIPYPLKIQAVMADYNRAEARIQEIVQEKWEIDMSKVDAEEFEKYDRAMGCAEKLVFFGKDALAYYKVVGKSAEYMAMVDRLSPFVVPRTSQDSIQCFRIVALELFGIK